MMRLRQWLEHITVLFFEKLKKRKEAEGESSEPTGDRQRSESGESRLKLLLWLSLGVVAGIALYGALSFSENLKATRARPAAESRVSEKLPSEPRMWKDGNSGGETTAEQLPSYELGTGTTTDATVIVDIGVSDAMRGQREVIATSTNRFDGGTVATTSTPTGYVTSTPSATQKQAPVSVTIKPVTQTDQPTPANQVGRAGTTPGVGRDAPATQTTTVIGGSATDSSTSGTTGEPKPQSPSSPEDEGSGRQSGPEPSEPTTTVLTEWSGDKETFWVVTDHPVSVFDSPESKNVIGTLKVGDFVKVLDETTVGETKFSKILRKTLSGDLVGWVRTSKLASSIDAVLGGGYDEIIYPVMPKKVGRVKDVRAIFLTRYSVNTPARLREWIKFAKRNNLNGFVIDVKDDDGFLLFKTNIAETVAPRANAEAFYTKEQMRELLQELKDNGIYVIARIVCFKDPTYARTHPGRAIVYKNTGELYRGIYKVPWASAYDRQLWKYNVEVAKETAEVGFDEIQYDYIRFPELTKEKRRQLNLREVPGESFAEAIQKFVLYAKKELMKYNIPLALDVFGLVCTAIDDVGIGQHWEALSSIVDYMCPMVYPSHYAYGSFGLSVPDAHPYETVYNSVLGGIRRNLQLATPARIRPWIQSFTATWVRGHIVYDESAIRKQIKALKDLGINEYMLWNAANKYHEMHYD